MAVACGLFVIVCTLLLRQHTYRFDLHNMPPSADNIEFSYPDCPASADNLPESIEAETPWLLQQRDKDYLLQALETEEPLEQKFLIADEIKQGTSFPEKAPHLGVLKEIRRADAVIFPAEEDYSHYEESLPGEIIDDSRSHHRHISDVNIKIKSKPPYFGTLPVIAVVIDDMGDNVRRTRDISSLRAPLTASFLTYPPHIERQVSRSRQAGHEIMVHVPMQPKSNINMTADILTVDMSPADIRRNFIHMLARFHDIKGINNHMGSRLTEDNARMDEIMKVLKERGLFFLDSKTTPHSVGDITAKRHGVDYVTRNVFLDNDNNLEYILGQLARAEKIARKNGYAIAIGHPKSQTYEALKKWLPTLAEKDIKLVHLSHIVSVLNGQGR